MMGYGYNQGSYYEAEQDQVYFNNSSGYNMGGLNGYQGGGFGNGFVADQASEFSSSNYSSVNPGYSYGTGMGMGMSMGMGGVASGFTQSSEQESFYATGNMASGFNMGCDPYRQFL